MTKTCILVFSILFLVKDLKMLTSVAWLLSYRKSKWTPQLYPVIPSYTQGRAPEISNMIHHCLKSTGNLILWHGSYLYLKVLFKCFQMISQNYTYTVLALQIIILFYGFSLDNIFSFNYLLNVEMSICGQIK